VRAAAQPPSTGAGRGEGEGAFHVRVRDFEGPFDLLLSLIARRRLEITALALHEVTDDYLSHITAQGPDWDLDEASQFLVVAATLLDLKAARLLPGGHVEDEEDVARFEARDLLFARLLQYRAYREAAAWCARQIESTARSWPRSVSMEPAFAGLLPEVLLGCDPATFAGLAARALARRPAPEVSLVHLHAPLVSVREQAALIAGELRRSGQVSFRSLIPGAGRPLIVARFLAVLELYRQAFIAIEQADAYGEIVLRWTGDAVSEVALDDEFDAAAMAVGA